MATESGCRTVGHHHAPVLIRISESISPTYAGIQYPGRGGLNPNGPLQLVQIDVVTQSGCHSTRTPLAGEAMMAQKISPGHKEQSTMNEAHLHSKQTWISPYFQARYSTHQIWLQTNPPLPDMLDGGCHNAEKLFTELW